MEKNTVQAKQWLDKCYLDSALLETTVKRWYGDFKRGCTDTNDAECSSCPAAGESHWKWPKTQSAGKILAFIFWEMQGIFFISYLEKGRTINSKYYITFLVHLKEGITKKRPQIKKKKVLFHQDNAPCQKLIAMMAKLHELHFKLLLHPPYSADLTPSNYWLFADLKRMFQGKKFGSNEKVI